MTSLPDTCPCCGAEKLGHQGIGDAMYKCYGAITETDNTACGWEWTSEYESDYHCPAMWRLLQETRAKLAALGAERGKS